MTSICKRLRTAAFAAAAAMALGTGSAPAAQKLVIAEPVHNLGYLPLYIAMDKGFFEEEGIEIAITTLQGGGAHTNAVLTKQAFAFIGGPEHNAFAKAKGAELRAVVNVVNRGNVYFVAAADLDPPVGDATALAEWIKGKTIATGQYGGTPNSITRYLLNDWGLDFKNDVTALEIAPDAVLAALRAGAADVGVVWEPMLTKGIREGIWGEPFYNVPKELGPYTYSTINIRQESIENDPALVEGFVRAIARGLAFTYAHPDEALAVAKAQFPTMAPEDMQATLDRAFADELWSPDGVIAPAAWETGKAVVMGADILKTDVPYEDIIDMSFVETLSAVD